VSLYVDTSAWLKRYIREADSTVANEYLGSDPLLVTGRHTIVEMRRNLGRLLEGSARSVAQRALVDDTDVFAIVELDEQTCAMAGDIAENIGVRTLDALHLGAARRALGAAGAFLTFDIRQAQAARALGFTVLGA
jgi:predicted nucleic acid-binding protein